MTDISIYKVYGRTDANLKYLATVSGLTYSDVGGILGTAVPPTANTTIESYIFDLPPP